MPTQVPGWLCMKCQSCFLIWCSRLRWLQVGSILNWLRIRSYERMVVIISYSEPLHILQPIRPMSRCDNYGPLQTHALVLRQQLSVALESTIFGGVGTIKYSILCRCSISDRLFFSGPPHLLSFPFIFVSLFVEVEFWPGEPQHLSVGEGVGGNKCIFESLLYSAFRARLPLSGWIPVRILPSGASFKT